MKKLFVIFLALSLLCLCACGTVPAEPTEPAEPTVAPTEETTAPAEEPLELLTPLPLPWEAQPPEKPDFSSVDEMTPNAEGFYQIHTPAGVANMANHPDGKFQLLWNVDMEGAQWTPIAEFTGTVDGQGYTISNFTVTAGESTGFIAVNKGTVKDLGLELTLSADKGIAGGIAAVNEGTITGCTVSGAMTLTGDVLAGGLVGQMTAGTLETSNAALTIEAAESCTAGLLTGEAKNVTVTDCRFTGPLSMKAEKQLTKLSGKQEKATFTGCLRRDNVASDLLLSEEETALRDKVVAKMFAMGTVKWIPQDTLMYVHPSTPVGNGLYVKGMTYTGLPYTANFGSLERFEYAVQEDGTLEPFILELGNKGTDIFDSYMGNDCSGAVYWSWATISNSAQWIVTQDMIPSMDQGTVAVGTYDSEGLDDTMQVIKRNGEEAIAETYTLLHKGDAVVTYYNNPDLPSDHRNHTRLVVEVVALRDQNGKLDLEESYMLSHGQGDGLSEPYHSTWEMYRKDTFRMLLDDQYISITCKELAGKPVPECTVTVDEPGEGKAYMTSGIVETNYRLISTTITITDAAGATVFEKTLFTSVYHFMDMQVGDPTREMVHSFDLAAFAEYLRDAELTAGETYTYTLSAMPSTGENMVVKTFEITG